MRPHRCDYDGLTPVFGAQGRYCAAPVTHKVTLGEIVDLLEKFHDQSRTLVVPADPGGQFCQKAVLAPTFPICRKKRLPSR